MTESAGFSTQAIHDGQEPEKALKVAITEAYGRA